jgi:hypothetical protein
MKNLQPDTMDRMDASIENTTSTYNQIQKLERVGFEKSLFQRLFVFEHAMTLVLEVAFQPLMELEGSNRVDGLKLLSLPSCRHQRPEVLPV